MEKQTILGFIFGFGMGALFTLGVFVPQAKQEAVEAALQRVQEIQAEKKAKANATD